MKAGANKLAWFMMALVFMLQAIVPTIALAEVTVRCVGAPASSAPCLETILPITASTGSTIKCSDMPCCRNKSRLTRACAMAMQVQPKADCHSHLTSTLSSPTCVVSIKPLVAGQTTISRSSQKWMLGAVPALTPPARGSYGLVKTDGLIIWSTSVFGPSPDKPINSHGLRAPPQA